MSFEEIERAREEEMEDRRMFARVNIRIPLRFIDLASGKEGKAEAIDISANGAGIVSSQGLPANNAIEMWLDIPDQHEALHLEGQVMWDQALNSNNHRFGVRLLKQQFIDLGRVLKFKQGS